MKTQMTTKDIEYLTRAKALLEYPSLAARITDLLGAPLEKGIKALPDGVQQKIETVSQTALTKTLDVAIQTLDGEEIPAPSNLGHKIAVAATGAVGGAFGWPALAVELPVTTTIMLRSISEIASSHGEVLSEVEGRLACIEVFALGGPSPSDDASESGYYLIRAALAKAVSDAARHVAARGLAEEGAPALVRLIAKVSSRFGLVVSEKAAAMSVPVIGALGGAAVNTLFMDHFQDVAEGHFTVRRLERSYGLENVRDTYNRIEI